MQFNYKRNVRLISQLRVVLLVLFTNSCVIAQELGAPQWAVQSPPEQSSDQANASNNIGSHIKKFAEMGMLEANEFLREVRHQELSAIFDLWLRAGRDDQDLTKQTAIGSSMAAALREQKVSGAFFAGLRQFLFDGRNSDHERAAILGVLAAAATKDSLDLLLYAAFNLLEQKLKEFAIADVAQVGGLDGGGAVLAPALEQVWRSSDNEALLRSVSSAMAKIGAPSSVELLLAAATNSDDVFKGKKELALASLDGVFKKEAIPPLAALLAEHSTVDETSRLAGSLLVEIGDVRAGEVLLGWLRKADENAAPLAREWVLGTRTPALKKAWGVALDKDAEFRSTVVREAILAGLAEKKSGRR